MSEVGGSEDHFGGPIVPNQQPKPHGPLIRHPQSELRALPVWAKVRPGHLCPFAELVSRYVSIRSAYSTTLLMQCGCGIALLLLAD